MSTFIQYSKNVNTNYFISDYNQRLLVLQEIKDLNLPLLLFMDNKLYNTRLVDFNSNTMYLDKPVFAYGEEGVVNKSKAVVQGSINGVIIEFDIHDLTHISINKYSVFEVYIPDMILKLQRREYNRLKAPSAYILNTDSSQHYIINDISLGGLSIEINEDQFHEFEDMFYAVVLHIPNVGNFSCQLELRNKVELNDGKRRIGFAFAFIDNNLYRNLQLYLMQLDNMSRNNF